ncbi:hypothetical protein GQ53DRAFT_752299 [Thozetella sp. PMI_491]|nr:hypothetical protein GQ53DRAFT_752299 [Thozetella sp. PMI_491]
MCSSSYLRATAVANTSSPPSCSAAAPSSSSSSTRTSEEASFVLYPPSPCLACYALLYKLCTRMMYAHLAPLMISHEMGGWAAREDGLICAKPSSQDASIGTSGTQHHSSPQGSWSLLKFGSNPGVGKGPSILLLRTARGLCNMHGRGAEYARNATSYKSRTLRVPFGGCLHPRRISSGETHNASK